MHGLWQYHSPAGGVFKGGGTENAVVHMISTDLPPAFILLFGALVGLALGVGLLWLAVRLAARRYERALAAAAPQGLESLLREMATDRPVTADELELALDSLHALERASAVASWPTASGQLEPRFLKNPENDPEALPRRGGSRREPPRCSFCAKVRDFFRA